MLATLGSLLRYSVSNIESMVCLEAEISWIKKYVFLQRDRFQNSFDCVYDVTEDAMGFPVYKMLLQPIIENTILHAFENVKEGGMINIEACVRKDGKLEIHIRDNGCGMDTLTLERIRKEIGENGALNSESIGISNVIHRLRIYYQEEADSIGEGQIMKKIIIVEDEFRIRNGLSTLINKLDMGCKVIGEAENGFEGLKMISDMEPEVVITDIKMPKMDGLSMIRQAKEMGASCDFIILSGYAEFEYAQQGIQLGVMDYLLKPASVSDVKELLNKLNEEKEITQGLDRENCSDIVREMINVIEESYGMKLQLDVIAEKFHMTPEYLGNLFAKETGITFSNYLRQVRMEKAKELLTGTDMKIYEVACAVGYPDQKYFSKVFKEYVGVSAKQFALKTVK